MKVWIPCIHANSGHDVFMRNLARGLKNLGYDVRFELLSRRYAFVPDALRLLPNRHKADVVIIGLEHAFALRQHAKKLVAILHHCVLDAAYQPYCTRLQKLLHRTAVRSWEGKSLKVSDVVVAVSNYTANSLQAALGGRRATVILNGIDVNYFCPSENTTRHRSSPFRLLYVGNPSRRKGADLLVPIMQRLGDDFILEYTGGLRAKSRLHRPNIHYLGRLSLDDLREAYRHADALLFPSRLEGFGYVVAEAMACGTPVVATDCSSIPELIDDKSTGLLCQIDNVDAFAKSIVELRTNPDLYEYIQRNAREKVVKNFSNDRWIRDYDTLLQKI